MQSKLLKLLLSITPAIVLLYNFGYILVSTRKDNLGLVIGYLNILFWSGLIIYAIYKFNKK